MNSYLFLVTANNRRSIGTGFSSFQTYAVHQVVEQGRAVLFLLGFNTKGLKRRNEDYNDTSYSNIHI